MRCYQVTCQFAFYKYKPYLVSTAIKKQIAKPFLIFSGLPFGHGIKFRRFFKTKKEAVHYAAHLKTIYTGRTVPPSALSGGQLSLF